MQTKNIYKLRELDEFMWGENKENILESIYSEDAFGTELQFKINIKNIDGNYEIVNMFEVSEKNLDELEFYGLKVVLNEKPKLRRKEQERISRESYFARDMNGNLYEYLDKPRQSKEFGRWQTDYAFIQINSDLFTFITWESGKAWSKAELMELEVVE